MLSAWFVDIHRYIIGNSRTCSSEGSICDFQPGVKQGYANCRLLRRDALCCARRLTWTTATFLFVNLDHWPYADLELLCLPACCFDSTQVDAKRVPVCDSAFPLQLQGSQFGTALSWTCLAMACHWRQMPLHNLEMPRGYMYHMQHSISGTQT